MTKIGDVFKALFSGDPTPGAPPTRLITASTPPPFRPTSLRPVSGGIQRFNSGGLDMTIRMTKDTLRQIIDSVELDPLAGQGCFTKKDILIDRLLAHWNTVERPAEAPSKPAAPIITEVVKPMPSVSVTKPPGVSPQNATGTATNAKAAQ